jgi:hypothetical protein
MDKVTVVRNAEDSRCYGNAFWYRGTYLINDVITYMYTKGQYTLYR